MARIVCTWELGGNLGHLSRLAGLAGELHQRGHEVIFIFRELHLAQKVFGTHTPYQFFQAPLHHQQTSTSRNPLTFSEILLCNGYADEQTLSYLIKAWKSLLEMISPDLIIYDYSPTALLASQTFNIPKIELGTGFFIHPDESPMPCFSTTQQISKEQRLKSDITVLNTINHALSREGLTPIEKIFDIFKNVRQLLTTYSELDCYKNREGAEYVGALTNKSTGIPATWKTDSPRIFAYLKPSYKKLPALLDALACTKAEIKIYIPNISEELLKKYQSKNIEFSTLPYSIDEAINGCSISICHAGHDTIVHSLLGGKPLLLIPQYIEQLEVAKKVSAIGCGLLANNNTENKDSLLEKLQTLLEKKSFQENANQFANDYKDMSIEKCINHVSNICAQLLKTNHE
ncbi:MAG: glycosyltransferase [Cellvibrionaceae bacterium]